MASIRDCTGLSKNTWPKLKRNEPMRRFVCLILPLFLFAACTSQAFSVEMAGIGIALKQEGEDFVVMRVLPDSPAAAHKGIHVGDRILAVAHENKLAVE